MAKKKILSAALAGGLAATGAEALPTKTIDADDVIDVSTIGATDIIVYADDPMGDTLTDALIDDMDHGLYIEIEEDLGEEVIMEIAQTIYAGPAGDGLMRPGTGGNITLDNGIKKGGNITLDNGIKKGSRIKTDGVRRQGKRKIGGAAKRRGKPRR